MIERIEIPRKILEWAITRGGYDIDDFLVSNQKVSEWMDGTNQPTIKQLEAFSNRVHLPFGYLFLENPAVEQFPIPFFRGGANDGHFDINTYETILTLQYRQNWLVDYLSDNLFDECSYVGSVNYRTPLERIVDQVRSLLDFPLTWAYSQRTQEDAVNHVTERLEEIGVTVVFNGIVGNNTHRKINVEECRGFSLVDTIAPFIFVNAADSKTAQLFTLIHEFAHLLLGYSSGFGGDLDSQQNVNERLCDRVAAEFLVPKEEFLKQWNNDIDRIAKRFKVSPIVIARRARDLDLITRQEFNNFYEEYVSHLHEINRLRGGNYYFNTKKRLGYTFAVHVNNALRSRQISYVEAYRLTGLYGETYNKFMSSL